MAVPPPAKVVSPRHAGGPVPRSSSWSAAARGRRAGGLDRSPDADPQDRGGHRFVRRSVHPLTRRSVEGRPSSGKRLSWSPLDRGPTCGSPGSRRIRGPHHACRILVMRRHRGLPRTRAPGALDCCGMSVGPPARTRIRKRASRSEHPKSASRRTRGAPGRRRESAAARHRPARLLVGQRQSSAVTPIGAARRDRKVARNQK
jgi:hypothetical protein